MAKIAIVANRHDTTPEVVANGDTLRRANRPLYVAKFLRPPSLASHLSMLPGRHVDDVDLGAVHHHETAVRREEASSDGQQPLGKIPVLRRIEDRVGRGTKRGALPRWGSCGHPIEERSHVEEHDVVALPEFAEERSLVSRSIGEEETDAFPPVTVQPVRDVRPVRGVDRLPATGAQLRVEQAGVCPHADVVGFVVGIGVDPARVVRRARGERLG
ncbi:hypothetical protein [Candidatus Palauibacter sp.]|uniref:hypothetical protein n=1 Tax=Candidatus Palauibacter sp. TaxID=3101350 RepID=UPI003B51FD38